MQLNQKSGEKKKGAIWEFLFETLKKPPTDAETQHDECEVHGFQVFAFQKQENGLSMINKASRRNHKAMS